jgi:two-component system, cell cycle sensor histidine kinase and response regulator CckA
MAGEGQTVRVLIVEDVATDAELARREVLSALPDAEFRVVDSREAYLAAIDAFQPDIILSDYQLPTFDGREALKLALVLCPDTPFIMVTGSINEDTAVECMKAGAWDYVIKDRIKRLGMAVQTALAEKDGRRARRQAERDLKYNNLLLATQQEASDDGILIIGPDNRMVSCNRRFAEMWRIPSDAIAERADGRVLATVLAQVEDPDAFLGRVAELKQSYGERGHDKVILRDGRTFDRYWAPMMASDGTPLGRVWFFRDITHALDLEARLLQAQRMESVGRLAGGVAHDFNNLLSVILTYTDFAMRRCQEGDPSRNDLSEVLKAGHRAAALTRQLLAFSRQQVLQPVALDLNEVVLGVEQMLRRLLTEDIEIVKALAPDLGAIRADPGQIEQVLMNLVVNARDAMPGGGRLTIATDNVEVSQDDQGAKELAPGSYVRLAVIDSGVGMDQQTMARIFEPFFTTKETGKGTGLGLAMVYGIVKQSGGDVRVRSEPGRGATFEIYLPRDFSAVVSKSLPSQEPAVESEGGETVLVVEDEAALRGAVGRTLEARGYQVLAAGDGQEALRVAEQHEGRIHMVVTDVVMPRMGGRALVEELARRRPGLKALFVSGYMHADLATTPAAGGVHFIGKPFSARQLARKVRMVLDGVDGPASVVAASEEDSGALSLGVLPVELAARLGQAIAAARYDEIADIVAALRSSHPDLASHLASLAERFDVEGMRKLLLGR